MIQRIPRTVASLSLIPIALAPSELAFRPAEGGSWRKSFAYEQELELERFRVVMNGEEVPADFLPQMEMTMRSTGTTVLVDRYVEVAAGRPLAIERHFQTIDVQHAMEFHMEVMGSPSEDHEGTVEGASALEGATVEFTWNAEHERYDARSDKDSLDGELLAGLVEETDLRSWLPEDDVEVGARWTIAGEELDRVLFPGGDLAIELEGEGAEYWRKDWHDRRLDGEVELVLEAIDRGDGGGRARIAIAGEVREVTEQEGDLSRVPVVQGEATQTDTTTHRLRGELVWDLAAGLPERLAIEAEVTLDSVTEKDEGDPDYEHSFVFAGSWRLEMQLERAE